MLNNPKAHHKLTRVPTDNYRGCSNAFLEEARKEPKRKLLTDHIETINLLRKREAIHFSCNGGMAERFKFWLQR